VVSRHCFNSACLKTFYGKTLHCQTLLPPRGTVWITHDLFFVMTIVRTHVEIRGSVKVWVYKHVTAHIYWYWNIINHAKRYIKEKSRQAMSWFSHNVFSYHLLAVATCNNLNKIIIGCCVFCDLNENKSIICNSKRFFRHQQIIVKLLLCLRIFRYAFDEQQILCKVKWEVNLAKSNSINTSDMISFRY